jgi:hypothetical protein
MTWRGMIFTKTVLSVLIELHTVCTLLYCRFLHKRRRRTGGTLRSLRTDSRELSLYSSTVLTYRPSSSFLPYQVYLTPTGMQRRSLSVWKQLFIIGTLVDTGRESAFVAHVIQDMPNIIAIDQRVFN